MTLVTVASCNPARVDPAAEGGASARAAPDIVVAADQLPGGAANVDVARMLELVAATAAERVGIKDPVFVIMALTCVDPAGRMDLREHAVCRGGLAGNVTGRHDRSRTALVGVGAAGVVTGRIAMDFSDAVPPACPAMRIMEIARSRLGTTGAVGISVRSGTTRDGTKAVWTVKPSPDGREISVSDTSCFSGE